MSQKADIIVRVEEDIQRLSGQSHELADKKLFKTKQIATVGELEAQIKRLLSKEVWNLRDLNELRTALNKWNNINTNAALSVENISEATKKYREELVALEKKETTARKELEKYESAHVGKATRDDNDHYHIEGLRRKYVEQLFNEYQHAHSADGKALITSRGTNAQFDTFWRNIGNPDKLKNIANSDAFMAILKEKTIETEKVLNQFVDALKVNTDALEAKRTEAPKEVEGNKIAAQNTAENDRTQRQLNNYESALTKIKDDGDNTATSVNNLNKGLQKQQTALGKAFKAFTIYNIVLRAAKSALREAVSTIKELDKSLTEQAMVTGKTRKETYALVKDYQNLALQVGATTKEVASVATEYMKQGKTVKDSLILTEAAISAAKVARVSVGDSVNYLTTALNGFQMEAEQAMLVSDKFAAVAASSATDYDELAIALSKVASQANLAGMSIDYTTALLTKGLETTREAPETMGTALKTIIARMREMTDYGATLEDGTNINNVEEQLSYVNIALRNSSGELRSTEDVLDELGKKWDTLNKNQQASIAKALAGTRQQSRLIAMMTDYERVTELQDIAARSAGATMAQAGTYLEGIEASINKISVAWEKIITGLTNSDLIVGILSQIGTFMDTMGNVLSHWTGQVALIGVLGFMLSGIIAKKQIENQIAKDQLKLQQLQQRQLLERRQEEIKQEILAKRGIKLDDAELAMLKAQYHQQIAINKAKTEEQKIEQGQVSVDATGSGSTENIEADNQRAIALQHVTDAQKALNEELSSGSELAKEFARNDEMIQFLENSAHSVTNLGFRLMALKNMIALITSHPVIAGVTALAAILVGVLTNIDWRTETEKETEQIQKLSNEIYKLNETSSKIDNLTRSLDDFDKKLIKTSKDAAEMKKIGESLAEAIDFTEGGTVDEKKAKQDKENFLSGGPAQQIKYAKEYRIKAQERAKKAAQEIIDKFDGNSKELLENTSNVLALRAANNARMYEHLDTLNLDSEKQKSVLTLMDQTMANASEEQVLQWAQNEELLKQTIDSIIELGEIDTLNGKSGNIIDILTSDDYSLVDKANAYNEAITKITDTSVRDALTKEYGSLAEFNKELLQFADNSQVGIEKLNAFAKALRKIGKETKENETIAKEMGEILDYIQKGGTAAEAITKILGLQKGTNEFKIAMNAIADALAIGLNNIGQNLDSFYNKINHFYEVSQKWSTMSASEQAKFIQENDKLFEGKDGQALLQAFKSQDFTTIEAALKENDALDKIRQDRIKEIKNQLAVETNEAVKEHLKAELQKLEDTEKVYKADYKLQLEQQKKQIDLYKEYVEKKQKVVEKEIEDRKKSYEDYFEAINKAEDEEKYQEKRSLIQENLSKLGAATDASSNASRAELEEKLQELDKEREEELRKSNQERILKNLDKQVEEINNHLEKISMSDKVAYEALTSSLKSNPNFLNDVAKTLSNGEMTDLQVQDLINDMKTTWSPIAGVDNSYWNNLQEDTANYNNTTYNINGLNMTFSAAQKEEFYKIILAAIREGGFGS